MGAKLRKIDYDIEKSLNIRLQEIPTIIDKGKKIILIFPTKGEWLSFNGTINELTDDYRDQFIKYLRDRKLVGDAKAEINSRGIITEEEILNIGISITNACNITCKHCYQSSSPQEGMKWDITKDEVLSILIFFANKFPNSIKYIHFSGGEIFLRKEVFEMISHAIKMGYAVRLSTNGTILGKIDEKHIRVLGNENIFPRVSIDGPDAETHGIYRPKETFEPAISGLKRLVKHNFNTGIKTVIHRKNLERIEEILDMAFNLGVNHFTYNTLKILGRAANNNLIRVGEDEVFNKLLGIVIKNPHYILLLRGSPFGDFITTTGIKDYRFLSFFNIYVNPEGKIYPQGDLQFDGLLLHDIRKEPIENFDFKRLHNFRQFDVTNQAACKKCFASKFCFGGNFGTRYLLDKTLEAEFYECDDLRAVISSAMTVPENIRSEIIQKYKDPIVSDQWSSRND